MFGDNDWAEVKKNLIENLTGDKRKIVDDILESQIRHLTAPEPVKEVKPLTEEEEADKIIDRLKGIKDPTDFDHILLPMIRRIMPQMVANEIMGVQPMMQPPAEPDSKIYSLRIKYTKAEDEE